MPDGLRKPFNFISFYIFGQLLSDFTGALLKQSMSHFKPIKFFSTITWNIVQILSQSSSWTYFKNMNVCLHYWCFDELHRSLHITVYLVYPIVMGETNAEGYLSVQPCSMFYASLVLHKHAFIFVLSHVQGSSPRKNKDKDQSIFQVLGNWTQNCGLGGALLYTYFSCLHTQPVEMRFKGKALSECCRSDTSTGVTIFRS